MTKTGHFWPRSARSLLSSEQDAPKRNCRGVLFLCRQSTGLHPVAGVNHVDVHQTICFVDIAGFGGGDRTRGNYVALRAGMYESVQQAFSAARVPWKSCKYQDVGDSVLVLAPAGVPKGAFAGELPAALAAALCAHNEAHPPEERIKLRLALHAGEVRFDEFGFASDALVHASRLLDARPLKDALAGSPGNLAMIVSDWFYTNVVRHHAGFEPHTYRRVGVEVKETRTVGWVRLPDHPSSAPPEVVRPEPPALIEVRPASTQFYEVVDALEELSCMRDEQQRAFVVDHLPFSGTVRYFSARRLHVASILRTCLDFENGVGRLVDVVSSVEPGESLPLKRLLTLLFGGA